MKNDNSYKESYLRYKKRREKRKKIIILVLIFIILPCLCLSTICFYNTKKNKQKKHVNYADQYDYIKPSLYLYPKKESKITVTFDNPNEIISSYPLYSDSWKVTAKTKGDLEDKSKTTYYALTWEEEKKNVSFDTGYYVTKNNALTFLEDKLKYIGLNDKERNEMIVSWLPVLVRNKKSIVYFELTKERDKQNKLNISPKPNSILRFVMHIKKVDRKPDNLEVQKLSHFNRKGFTVIECSGALHI